MTLSKTILGISTTEKEHSRSKAARGQVQPGGERLQLHLDRDQAGVADVFGTWERVSGKQKYVCVLGAYLVFVSVYLDRVCGEHLHLHLGCNREGSGNKTRCILLT